MAEALHDLRAERKRAAGSYTPTEEERGAISLMTRRWKPDDPIRRHLEQQWLTNIAFLIGFQYLTWDPVQRQLVYAQTPSLRWRARAVHNLIRPYVELDIGTVGTFTPSFKCRPRNDDPENHEAALANEEILESYWDTLRMPGKKYDLLYWVKTCGNGFIRLGWDKTLGEVTRGETETVTLKDGTWINVTTPEYDGDISSTVESPLTIYTDNTAQDVDDLRWLIHCRARPIEWVEDHYPEKSAFVTTGIQLDNIINRQRWVLDLAGPAAVFGGGQPESVKENWCLVREYWERPSLDYPKGRYFVECNGIVLDGPRDNPTPDGSLPFVWVRDALVPGRIWAQCNVDNLITMQRSLNRFISKKEEHIVLTANAKILEHATNNLDASAWMTEIGEVIKWHGMQRPDYLIPPPMPPETDTEIQRLEHHFDLVTSQYGPARGQYPGKISGKAINVLIEQNVQNKTPMIERFAESLKQWGHLVLEIAQEYVQEPRLIKIVGRAKGWSIKEFQGQNIKGNTEVSIDIESMIPKSRMMALDMIQTLSGLGWLNPMNPKDHARVWKSLAMEDDAPLVEDTTLDLRVARNENKLLLMGTLPPSANFLEDQDTHMLAHAELTKSDEWKQAHPLIQQMTWAHIQSHMDIVAPKVGVTQPAAGAEESFMGQDQAAAPQQQLAPTAQRAQAAPAMVPFS